MSYLEGLPNLPNGSQSLGGIPHQKENNATDKDDNSWLHRNGAYQMQQIAGRMRVVAMPLGQEGIDPFIGSNQPQNTRTKCMSENAGQTNGKLQSNMVNPTSATNLYCYYALLICNDQADDPAGIFEPFFQQSNLEGTFIYCHAHSKCFTKTIMFDQYITS
jgi:hypothetical protein